VFLLGTGNVREASLVFTYNVVTKPILISYFKALLS